MHILVVDDEIHILELIEYNIKKEGYDVTLARSGEEAIELSKTIEFDMILLDWMLPKMSGIEVLKIIRKQSERWIPVIILTAKTDEMSKVMGLDVGADDYLSKPFGVAELTARIRALLRRDQNSKNSTKEIRKDENLIGNEFIKMDILGREVFADGERKTLSLKEFELLKFLIENKECVFSRESLLDKIWGYDYYGGTRTVDVHVSNLRKKIEKSENNPVFLKTVRGIGYKFTG